MATITKQSYSVVITTIKGTTVTAADSSTSKEGTLAFQAFMAGQTIKTGGAGSYVYIPFHAIDNIAVTVTPASETVEDSTCVVESTNDDNNDVGD